MANVVELYGPYTWAGTPMAPNAVHSKRHGAFSVGGGAAHHGEVSVTVHPFRENYPVSMRVENLGVAYTSLTEGFYLDFVVRNTGTTYVYGYNYWITWNRTS